MTRVCLVGEDGVDVQYELLSRETARAALSAYQPAEPYENTLAVETVSLGAAVSLLNDLNWYLTRFVDAALVREPSIDPEEWLSRDLATAVRNGDLDPAATGERLMVYGVDDGRLVEPMYVRRSGAAETAETAPEADPVAPGTPSVPESDGGVHPDYDLREVEETVVVRVTEAEFAG